jgi:hypothetical protein
MTIKTILKSLFIVSLIVATFFSACKKSEPETPKNQVIGQLRMYNGAVDAPAVDFLINGSKTNSDSLSYNKGTVYLPVVLDSVKKTVYKILNAKTQAVIVTDSLTMKDTAKNVGYTVFFYQENDKSHKAIYTPEDLLLPSAGKAKVRIAHLIPDVNNNLDIEAVPVGTAAGDGGFAVNVPFKSVRDFVQLNKGTYDIKIKLAGTRQLAFANQPTKVTIEEGKIYTFVLRGLANFTGTRGATLAVLTHR